MKPSIIILAFLFSELLYAQEFQVFNNKYSINNIHASVDTSYQLVHTVNLQEVTIYHQDYARFDSLVNNPLWLSTNIHFILGKKENQSIRWEDSFMAPKGYEITSPKKNRLRSNIEGIYDL